MSKLHTLVHTVHISGLNIQQGTDSILESCGQDYIQENIPQVYVNKDRAYTLCPLAGHHSSLVDMSAQLLANIGCHVVDHNQVNKSHNVCPRTLLGNCKLVENQLQGNTQ